jgi:hypothetical protein
MKAILIFLIVFSAILFTIQPVCAGDTYVKGYYRNDGTYVQPHYRSAPDSNRMNNYSYPGNVNPYTGQRAPRSSNPSYNYPSNPNPYNSYPRTGIQRRSAYGD